MSKRRNPGDIVRKLPNHGFVGEALTVRVLPEPDDDPMPCMLECGDPACLEWHECAVLGADGTRRGVVCHVSECGMADLADDLTPTFRMVREGEK